MGGKPTRVTNAIRALRFARGEMTQAELAERVGVTRQTVIAIEQGRYSPSLETAFLIARALGTTLDEVFAYPDDDTDAPAGPAAGDVGGATDKATDGRGPRRRRATR